MAYFRAIGEFDRGEPVVGSLSSRYSSADGGLLLTAHGEKAATGSLPKREIFERKWSPRSTLLLSVGSAVVLWFAIAFVLFEMM